MKRTCEYCGKTGEPEEACDCPERVVCEKAGERGHTMCGTCPTCSVPRFQGCYCNRETMTELPTLAKTEAAILAYDAHDEICTVDNVEDLPRGAATKMFDERARLAREVGVAFGEETKDRNDPQTCTDLIRPGPSTPPLGETDVSFVRRMVRDWRAAQ